MAETAGDARKGEMMTTEETINQAVSDELIRTMVDSIMAKWADEPPYELRGAFIQAIKIKLEVSPLIEEITELVILKLSERKDEIADAAVRAIIEGVAGSLQSLYREVAKKATKAAEDAFRRY